jgi:putative DNA primase/helicase
MAADIAAALGDVRREGRAWRCRCPLHGGRSLSIRDGDGGRVLVWCWAGCSSLDVLAELRQRGLLGGPADYAPRVISGDRHNDDASRTKRALNIWHVAKDGADTIACRYLASRGIAFDQWPQTLRFHPRCPRPKHKNGNFVSPLPAMVGLVEHIEHGPVAVHCTYLRPNGSGKADVEIPKAIFGPSASGAVRFGVLRAGTWLAISEGIETALSVAIACSIPAWAALSATGIKNLVLPPEATHVVVCADHDANRTGQRAAYDAAARWYAEGRRVRVAMPPEPGSDFNDMLCGATAVSINEALHVA